VATAASVFAHVAAAAEPAVWRGRRFGNLVLAASAAGLPTAEIARRTASAAFPARCVHGAELRKLAGKAAVITDADAPPPPKPPDDVLGLF